MSDDAITPSSIDRPEDVNKEAELSNLGYDLAKYEIETKREMMSFLRRLMQGNSSRTQLRNKIIGRLLDKLDDDNVDVSVMTLAKILSTLDESETANSANVLSVLKQHVVVEQRHTTDKMPALSSPGAGPVPSEGMTKEDLTDVKKVWEFLELLKQKKGGSGE